MKRLEIQHVADTGLHFLKIQGPSFTRALPRIYPKRINSFLQRSQTWDHPQIIELLRIFYSRNQFFTENQNGPYGT